LTKSKDFEVQYGAAPKETDQGSEQREEECLHPGDTTAREDKKSKKKSIGIKFLVGTLFGATALEQGRKARGLGKGVGEGHIAAL
jgi:hypothetical protein